MFIYHIITVCKKKKKITNLFNKIGAGIAEYPPQANTVMHRSGITHTSGEAQLKGKEREDNRKRGKIFLKSERERELD